MRRGVAAKADCKDRLVAFPMPALADMGRELAKLGIAHELAHITYFIAKELNHCKLR